jgi:hypothetical protein
MTKVTNETVENTKTDASTTNATASAENTTDPNQVVLLGSISYTDEFQYEEWLKNMDLNQAIFVLVANANYAQSKGLLSIAESELVAGALRTIKKNSKQTPVAPVVDSKNVTEDKSSK